LEFIKTAKIRMKKSLKILFSVLFIGSLTALFFTTDIFDLGMAEAGELKNVRI